MIVEPIARVLVYRDEEAVHARLVGPVNRETIPLFQQRLEGALSDEPITLALDLGGAEYVDSDGVRWLRQLQSELAEQDQTLVLAIREGSRVERVLHLLRLEHSFTIHKYPAELESAAAKHPMVH